MMEPNSVRLVLLDGTEVTVESHYDGVDEAGVHQWTLVTPSGVTLTPGMSLRVAVEVPPHHQG